VGKRRLGRCRLTPRCVRLFSRLIESEGVRQRCTRPASKHKSMPWEPVSNSSRLSNNTRETPVSNSQLNFGVPLVPGQTQPDRAPCRQGKVARGQGRTPNRATSRMMTQSESRVQRHGRIRAGAGGRSVGRWWLTSA